MPDGRLQVQIHGTTFTSTDVAPEKMDVATIENWCGAVRAFARQAEDVRERKPRAPAPEKERAADAESPDEYVRVNFHRAKARHAELEKEYTQAEHDLFKWRLLYETLQLEETEEKEDD